MEGFAFRAVLGLIVVFLIYYFIDTLVTKLGKRRVSGTTKTKVKKALIVTIFIVLDIAVLGFAFILFRVIFGFVMALNAEMKGYAPQYSVAFTAPAPMPISSVMPVLLYYVNVDEANVYEQKDTTSKVFDTIVRCTQVVVNQEGFDPDWLHVIYSKESVVYKGFVQTKQFTNSRPECSLPNTDPVP